MTDEEKNITLAAIEEAKAQQESYNNGTPIPDPVDLSSVENMLESMGIKS